MWKWVAGIAMALVFLLVALLASQLLFSLIPDSIEWVAGIPILFILAGGLFAYRQFLALLSDPDDRPNESPSSEKR